LLTECEPIGSHELFNRLISKQVLTGEDEANESELKYLNVIKDIRDKEPKLFDGIKNLPKKARSAKRSQEYKNHLLTYFRRAKLQKFFLAGDSDPEEFDFMSAAGILESKEDEKKQKLPEGYDGILNKNKQAFIEATTEELMKAEHKGSRDSATSILRILKATLQNTEQFTEEQELYLKRVVIQLEQGGLPKQTTKETLKALKNLKQDLTNPFRVLGTLQMHIPEQLLKSHYAGQNLDISGKREVILSLYLTEE
jgi:hypothetical protein